MAPDARVQPTTLAAPHLDWSMRTHRREHSLSRPRATTITSFTRLTPGHIAFAVDDAELRDADPGQFAMLWVPGVDEVPMGISATDPATGETWFLVLEVGGCTRAMGQLGIGDRIGVRGPYGRPFDLPDDGHVLLVGGGTGTAPLLRTVDAAASRGTRSTVVLGARSKELLVFEDRFRASADATHPCTDDGTYGFHGYTTDQTEALLAADASRYDMVLTCGPEKMMHKVAAIAERHGVPCQASVERWMKCGIGVCGSCVMGEGIRSCVEGPCFPTAELASVPDFGKFHRGPSGAVEPY